MGNVYQVGTVRSVRGGVAEVMIVRGLSCGESCAGCAKSCSGAGIMVLLDNSVNARAGDRVKIQAAGGNIVALTAFTYLLPLLLLVTGMVYGGSLMQKLNPAFDADAAGLIVGVIALVLFSLILKIVGGRLVLRGENKPKIIAVINE